MSELKKQYGWSVVILLPITPFFARLCNKFKISANLVSVSSLFVFLIGMYFYFFYNDNIFFRLIAIAIKRKKILSL